jgi:hypothetical protein
MAVDSRVVQLEDRRASPLQEVAVVRHLPTCVSV